MPETKRKRLWASLPQDQDGEPISATDETLGWPAQEVGRRNPDSQKPTALLMDGQKSLWEAGQRDLPVDEMIEILDLLHDTPRIWQPVCFTFAIRNSLETLLTTGCFGCCAVRSAR